MNQPCPCRNCTAEREAHLPWLERMATRLMIVCATCGNKRCPHANDHNLACTGSNATGQYPGPVLPPE